MCKRVIYIVLLVLFIFYVNCEDEFEVFESDDCLGEFEILSYVQGPKVLCLKQHPITDLHLLFYDLQLTIEFHTNFPNVRSISLHLLHNSIHYVKHKII